MCIQIHFRAKQHGFPLSDPPLLHAIFFSSAENKVIIWGGLFTCVAYIRRIIPLSVGEKWWIFTEERIGEYFKSWHAKNNGCKKEEKN